MGVLDFLKVKKGPMQTQIGEIEAQLERLRAERRAAETIVEGHGQKRSDMLLSDASDGDIAHLDADAGLAHIRLERLELAELELQDRLDRARDSVARSTRAAELERAASSIEEKAKSLESAIAALGAAFDDLVRAIPHDAGVQRDCDTMTKPATPEDVARAVLAQGLFCAAPSIFEMVAARTRSLRPACVERVLNVYAIRDGTLTRFNNGLVGEECEIAPAPFAAEQFIVAPLRAQAAALRASDDMRAAAE